jgi:cysteine desulfurase
MIYLDNNATTPIDERVLEKALPFLTTHFGNASSTHSAGKTASEAVSKARLQVAQLLNAEPNEITFTSGATEGINLALRGLAEAHQGTKNHIITLQTEHTAVLDTCRYLETVGFEVDYLTVLPTGLVDLEVLQKAFRQDTLLVCVMLANNEIGTIQDMKSIAEIAHAHGAIVFTDATQAVGKIPVNVRELDVDMLVLSGHKFYAPKGVGVFYKNAQKRIKILPTQYGGGHEKGLRSGTLNVFGIVALGEACAIAGKEMKDNMLKVKELRDYLETQLLAIEDTFVNGKTDSRMFNVTNICFRGVESEAMILGLEEVAVSNGSACTSMKIEPSHVLKAIGLSDEEAFQSIRFSLGKFNTKEEIDESVTLVKKTIKNLRDLL